MPDVTGTLEGFEPAQAARVTADFTDKGSCVIWRVSGDEVSDGFQVNPGAGWVTSSLPYLERGFDESYFSASTVVKSRQTSLKRNHCLPKLLEVKRMPGTNGFGTSFVSP